ncbi:MAG: GntR family transcriptional regulator [Hyphomicrobiales bacterium]|nr:MAG: GntR family transcriptional regulator [Hyphomicrobiales bacterium]
MTKNPKKQTAADRVRMVLADEIVRGVIGPGVPLDEASIAERFEVSRTPVREAIRQLEAIGFAEARPHRGAVVPHFTPEKLNEIFLVMAELEALCARLAAEFATAADKDALQKVHLACRDAAHEGDIGRYYELNIKFHETIYAIGHNGFLAEVTIGVRNRVAPFRRAQFQSLGRLTRSVEEHEAVVSAILAGDADKAAATMREHLGYVRTSVDKVAPALGA